MHALYFVCAAAVADLTALKNTVKKYGYALPMPAGTVWSQYEDLAFAPNLVYAYVPLLNSPPILTVDTNKDTKKLFDCKGDNGCTLSAHVLTTNAEEDVFYKTLQMLLVHYGKKTSEVENIKKGSPVPANIFASFGVDNRACDSNSDCKSDFTCCSKSDAGAFPGICCSKIKLNQYDSEVPNWVWIFFLSGAGLLLLGWIVRSFHLLDKFF